MADNTEGLSYYEDPDNLKKLCNFLRSKHGPAVREATLMEKRVYYIKGTVPLACLLALEQVIY